MLIPSAGLMKRGKKDLRQAGAEVCQAQTNFTLYLVRTGFSKIEPVTCKILTFLPKNSGIKLKTMHARGIYEKVFQAT